MTGSNLLALVLVLGVSMITVVITTTVSTETSITLDQPIELSTQVEGDVVLDNCIESCLLHYNGTVNVSLTQTEKNEPFHIDSEFTMNGIEVVEVESSATSEVESSATSEVVQ